MKEDKQCEMIFNKMIYIYIYTLFFVSNFVIICFSPHLIILGRNQTKSTDSKALYYPVFFTILFVFFFRNPSGCKSFDGISHFSECDRSVHRILLPEVSQNEKYGAIDQGQTDAKCRDLVYHCW